MLQNQIKNVYVKKMSIFFVLQACCKFCKTLKDSNLHNSLVKSYRYKFVSIKTFFGVQLYTKIGKFSEENIFIHIFCVSIGRSVLDICSP